MDVPFFHEETDSTCAAAAIQMCAAYYGITISQQDLIEKLKISVHGEGKKIHMREVLTELGLTYSEYAEVSPVDQSSHVKHLASGNLEAMLGYIDRRIPVIVNYIMLDKVGHYAIVTGYTPTEIILNDPYDKEPGYRMSKDEFVKDWISGNKLWHKWFMTVEKRTG